MNSLRKFASAVFLFVILCLSACSSDTLTAPTQSDVPGGSSSVSSPTPQVEEPTLTLPPTPPPPTGQKSSTPVYSIYGPTGCVDAQNMSAQNLNLVGLGWMLDVQDAGPSQLRFIALSHHSNVPGCEPTIENPRPRVVVNGVKDYTPHSSGSTTFSFNANEFSCGRTQIDVSIFDATGKEILIIATMINYGKMCEPEAIPVSCKADQETVKTENIASFTASGGDGNFSWSAPTGTPQTDTGGRFTVAYRDIGEKTVTVTSAGKQAQCKVKVTATEEIFPPKCEAVIAPRAVKAQEFANLTVTTMYATEATIGNDRVSLDQNGVGLVTLKPGQEYAGTTREYTINVVGPGGRAMCSAKLEILSEPICSAELQFKWLADRLPAPALEISASVNPHDDKEFSVPIMIDGVNAGPIMMGRFGTKVYYPFPQDGQSHTLSGTLSHLHSNGHLCSADASALVPAVQSCEVLNPPRFDTPVLTTNPLKSLVASVTVYNAAEWKAVLYASREISSYPNNQEYEKAMDKRTLQCGEKKVIGFSYDWANHHAKVWWMKLYKDGVEVYTSPAVTK